MITIDLPSTGYLIFAIIIALMTIIVLGGIALLWGISPLISPGPLTAANTGAPLGGYRSHADFENDCLLCHSPWSGSSNNRCLACHIDVSLETRGQTDLHGRLPPPVQCYQCHPEHRGREAQIAKVLLDTYPHERTNFDLLGGHNNIACVDCHPNNQYRQTATACDTCHPEPDSHTGKYGVNCQQCHAVPYNSGFIVQAWTPLTLDHRFFPLTGGHAAAVCEQCHLTPEFEQTSNACVACHVEPEAHFGWYGTACANCHTSNSWTPSTFDHNRLAFSLNGKHAALACEACHTNHQFIETPSLCASCHHKPDFHSSGRFGERCQMCHTVEGWYPASLRQHSFPVEHGSLDRTPTDCLTCHPQGYAAYRCDVCHHDEQVDPALMMN